ncbi:unnamed protein product, partial [Mesorhabditis spiculigera]
MALKIRTTLLFILSGLFLVQILLYFYSSGAQKATHKWKRRQCDCPGIENCYPHPKDEHLCGRCFTCNKEKINKVKSIIKDTAIMLITNEEQLNELMITIASIHKHYPERQILVYNSFLSPQTALPRKLHALAQYESVLWVSEGMEFRSRSIDSQLEYGNVPVVLYGRVSLKPVSVLGFTPFFPGADFYPKNFTAAHFKTASWETIEWLTKCAGTASCYDCRAADGTALDCLPYLLARFSADRPIEYRSLPGNSLEAQGTKPPECDLKEYNMLKLYLLILLILINECFGMSVLEAYNDPRWSRRRQGMLNTRFTPVAHQRGDDDWQKQLGQARLVGKIMDENEIGFEVAPPVNGRINSVFNRAVFSPETKTHPAEGRADEALVICFGPKHIAAVYG